jgi:DNA-binding MarR family transcriptional regulator
MVGGQHHKVSGQFRTLAPFDIRPAQYSVLVLVGANPGRSQSDIGDALDVERARLVRLLDELEQRGLVQRLPSATDRRSHALFLTGPGGKFLARIKALAARHETNVESTVGVRRRKQLLGLLKEFG